jgi:hypothetical protein
MSAVLVPVVSGEASAAPAIRFSKVYYDSPGTPDRGSNRSLNGEWAAIHNYSATSKTLTGWTVRDPERHVYKFPTFTLRPGTTVRLHTGKGTNSHTDIYWGASWYVWNNTSDKAILNNRAGTTIDTCAWSSSAVDVKTC